MNLYDCFSYLEATAYVSLCFLQYHNCFFFVQLELVFDEIAVTLVLHSLQPVYAQPLSYCMLCTLA